jgi:P4 family phage/plasmid primase-like protien
MKYKRISFDDLGTLLDIEKYSQMDDDTFEAYIEDRNNINMLFDAEIKNLTDQKINIISIDKDVENVTLSCIFEDPENKQIPRLNLLPQITNCDKNGKSITEVKSQGDTETSNIITQLLKSQGIAVCIHKEDGIEFDCPICNQHDIKCKIFYNTGLINAFRNTCSTDKEHIKLFNTLSNKARTLIKEAKKNKNQELLSEKAHKLQVPIKVDKNLEMYEFSDEKGYWIKLSTRRLEKYIYDQCEPTDRKEYNDLLGEIRNDYNPEPFADSHLMNMQNGIYDIKEDKLLEKDQNAFFTYLIPADYNPAASSELLYNTVKQIFGNKDEMITEFKKALGYSIHDTCRFEKGFVLRGTKNGSNGKDTILGLLVGCKENNYRGLFSHLSVISSITRLNDTFSHNLIENKKLWVDTDYNEMYLKGTAIIRKMISGVTIEIREPFKPPRNINANCKPWIACNTLPKLENNDGGWWRRWQIFDCQLTFGGKGGAKKDPTLKFKLNTDVVYSTLFNWMVEGYKMVDNHTIDNGEFFKENDAAIETWKKQANNIILFLEEECNINPDKKTKRALLYKYYKQHCINSGTKPLGKQNFYEKVVCEASIHHKKSNGIDWFIGIELKGEFNNEDTGL